MIHSSSTQQIIMVELTVPYEGRMEETHTFKREKYLNLTKELRDAGYKAVAMPVEVGARGFIGSSVYDLLTKLSLCGNKRTKALKLLAEVMVSQLCLMCGSTLNCQTLCREARPRYSLVVDEDVKKPTNQLKLLAEIAENSSRWIWSKRNERSLHKN